MSDITPPNALVMNWLSLAYYSCDPGAKRHAVKLLVKVFGGIEFAVMFEEDNGFGPETSAIRST